MSTRLFKLCFSKASLQKSPRNALKNPGVKITAMWYYHLPSLYCTWGMFQEANHTAQRHSITITLSKLFLLTCSIWFAFYYLLSYVKEISDKGSDLPLKLSRVQLQLWQVGWSTLSANALPQVETWVNPSISHAPLGPDTATSHGEEEQTNKQTPTNNDDKTQTIQILPEMLMVILIEYTATRGHGRGALVAEQCSDLQSALY